MHKVPYKYTIEKIDNILKESNIKRLGEYSYSTPFLVKCEKDNYEWLLNFNNFISHKTKCPKCQNRIPLSNKDIDERLKNRNIKRLGSIDGYNTHHKIEFQCEIDGYKWVASPNKILVAKRGCPLCSKNKGGIKLTNEEIDIKLIGRNIKRLGKYKNNKTKIDFQCEIDNHIWEATPNHILTGRGCPLCKHKGEKKLADSIRHILQFDYFKHHKHFIIDKRKYIPDFFIKINNREIIIERNGEQHYRPIDFGQGKEKSEEDFLKQQKRDIIFKNYCLNNNIEHYEFPYSWSDDECINKLKEINDGRTK